MVNTHVGLCLQIDVYVYVACPENSFFDSKEFYRPVVTPYELEVALNPNRTWGAHFSTDFNDILPGIMFRSYVINTNFLIKFFKRFSLYWSYRSIICHFMQSSCMWVLVMGSHYLKSSTLIKSAYFHCSYWRLSVFKVHRLMLPPQKTWRAHWITRLRWSLGKYEHLETRLYQMNRLKITEFLV